MPANTQSQSLTVSEEGLPPLELEDLLVGEIWLGSDQSNVDLRVSQTCAEDQVLTAAGHMPLLRLFQVPMTVSHTRQNIVSGKWNPPTPKAMLDASAVAYFFGKRLVEELNIPVGIIHSSWGGSCIEPWWADQAGKAMDSGKLVPQMPPAPALLKLGHRAETGLYTVAHQELRILVE